MLPRREIDTLLLTVTDAVATKGKAAEGSLADCGDGCGGHDELYGLERAEAVRDDGEAWGAELVGPWTRALERYAERWRIGRA